MMTITEALAELKTLEKRMESKRTFIREYAFRLDSLKDPFEKDGGSAQKVQSEMQALQDLESRAVSIREAISVANMETMVSIAGLEMSIANWLVWRREIAPNKERFLFELRQRLIGARDAVRKQNVNWGNTPVPEKPLDIVVSIDEAKVNTDLETIKDILGQLDGQLSLKNATVTVDVKPL